MCGRNIFLDDIRKPFKGFDLYTTAESLIEDIKEGKITKIGILSLDHDLGIDNKNKLRMNGSQFVKELVYLMVDDYLTIDFIQFHTSNYIGYEYMKTTLDRAVKRGYITTNVDTKLINYLEEMRRNN